MSAIFILKKKQPKHIFFLKKPRYFGMDGPIDMNVHVFCETSVDFLKSVVLQLISK